MNSQSPSAYVLSALIHAAAVALLFGVAHIMSTQVRPPAKFIEVVAGAGDNWSATEAPALGSPDGSEDIKVPNMPGPTIPKIDNPAPPPEPEPQPPAPEPEPTPVAPPPPEEKVPVKKAPEPKPEPKHDPNSPTAILERKRTLADDVKRRVAIQENRTMQKIRRKEAAEEAAARKAAAEAAKRMSKAEFDKMNAAKGGKPGSGSKISRVDAKGIAGGVVGGSTSNTKGGAGGKALSVAEQNLLDQYFAYLKIKLKQAHIPPPGTGDSLTTTVQFYLSSTGGISSVKVLRSSGNSEFDQSVVDAFRRVSSIGPRPDGRSEELVIEFNTKED